MGVKEVLRMMWKMMKQGRGVKLVKTLMEMQSSAVGIVVGLKLRKRTKKVGRERGVKLVTTKWVKRRIAIGNAVLPAKTKMVSNVIGNGAMPAKLVMTTTILLNVLTVIDKRFWLK